jgi:hypothetical protein
VAVHRSQVAPRRSRDAESSERSAATPRAPRSAATPRPGSLPQRFASPPALFYASS